MSYLDEEFDLGQKRGLCLVCGKNFDVAKASNASGKSSLFYALVYCLYGQLQTALVNKYIKNRYAEDPETYVDLHFLANKVHYHLKRSLNRAAQTTLSLKKIDVKHGVEIDLNKSSVNETQDFLEREILHCDISIFLRTVLLSSDQTYNFFTLKPALKRDFIEKLFNIGVFTEMYRLIHTDNLKNKKEIVAGQNRLLVLSRNNEDFKTRKSQFESKLNEERDALVEELKSLRTKLNEDSSSKDGGRSAEEKTAFEQYVKDTEAKLEEYAAAKRKLNEMYNKLRTARSDIEKKLMKAKTTMSVNSSLIASHSEVIDMVCAKCKPVLREHYDIGTAESAVAAASGEVSALEAKLKKAEEKLLEIQTKANTIGVDERNLMAELSKRTIEANGGRNSSSVSGKTSFLLAGSKPGPEKVKKAQDLGVRIISEEEFFEMLPAGEHVVEDNAEPTLF